MTESELMLKIARDTLLVDELAAMGRSARYNRMGVIASENGLEFSEYMRAAVDGCCEAWLKAKELREMPNSFKAHAQAFISTLRPRIDSVVSSCSGDEFLRDRIIDLVEIAWMSGSIEARARTIDKLKDEVLHD